MRLLLVLLSFSCLNVYAQSQVRKERLQVIKRIEKNYRKLMAKEKFTDDQKFLVFLDGGRELYNFFFYDKAEFYLKEALKLNTQNDQTEAFAFLASIYRLEHKDKLKKLYKDWQNYNQKHPVFAQTQYNHLDYLALKAEFEPENLNSEQKDILRASQYAPLLSNR